MKVMKKLKNFIRWILLLVILKKLIISLIFLVFVCIHVFILIMKFIY